MKIALSTDHAGFDALKQLKAFLESEGHECVNYGPTEYVPGDDYPDYIRPAADAVASGECEFGIIFGMSGQGEAMTANRVKGVRCGIYYGPTSMDNVATSDDEVDDTHEIIKLHRQHNNGNMLSLGARFLSQADIHTAVKLWLATPFSGDERHLRRIQKLDA